VHVIACSVGLDRRRTGPIRRKTPIRYHRLPDAGDDTVSGSRFMKSSSVNDHPRPKLSANRIANRWIRGTFRDGCTGNPPEGHV
jgi:hypothetical protein